ncbi:hypothetical protein [Leptotrichia shahii]|uniref:hypothetical protein n=1 Tax=Leptotrichia shahii TaxID=157691 RepID=UPI0028D3F176|nr:hypothetical protein [Leptotrichia shahii]
MVIHGDYLEDKLKYLVYMLKIKNFIKYWIIYLEKDIEKLVKNYKFVKKLLD